MSWEQLTEKDALGTSRFQNLCCRALTNFMPGLIISEEGDDEKHYVADFGVNNTSVVVYLDAVVISSLELNIRLAAVDYSTPADLVQQLQKRLSNAI